MIYAFEAVVIHTDKGAVWQRLIEAVKDPRNFSNSITDAVIDEQCLRSVCTNDGHVNEQINIDSLNRKIIAKLVDHSLYRGETIFQIIAPEDESLCNQRAALIIMLIWRLHPGIIEAPIINKQPFITEFANSIKNSLITA